MSEQPRRGLGRSLDALLGTVGRHADASHATEPELREIAVDCLQPGRHQPRRRFDEQALADLAASIAAQGVVQPIVVRFVGPERFEIVAGERRWRAAQLAGLKTIPAVIRSLDDRGAMAVALVENIQRADLNPLEEAVALHKLIERNRTSHGMGQYIESRRITYPVNHTQEQEHYQTTNTLILVTGATGTIGSEVVKQLVQGGHRVRALVRDPAKRSVYD